METASSQAPLKVRELGGFPLVRELGQGGMGKVFLARQPSLDREVALKVLQPDLARNAEFVQRFVAEARVAAKFHHPHVVEVYDGGRDEKSGLHYIAFEYLAGGSVEQLLRKQGRLGELESLRIAHAVAQALVFAESKGLVHRDIKPENILLSAEGTPKLADLGLVKDLNSTAQVTQTGMVLGTPHYMSPEQALGDRPLDVRSDIYSLGLCLWRCLAGAVPYDAEGGSASPLQILNRHIHTDLVDVRERAPEVGEATAKLIARMSAREPEERFKTAAELVEALGQRMRQLVGQGAAASAAPAAAPTHAARKASSGAAAALPSTAVSPAPQPGQAEDEASSRGPALVLGGVMLVLLVLLGAGFSLAFRRAPEQAATPPPVGPPPAPPAVDTPAESPPPPVIETPPPTPPPQEAPPEAPPAEGPPPAPPPAGTPSPEAPLETPPAETPPLPPVSPPAPGLEDGARQARTQFMAKANGLRRALREDLRRLPGELQQLQELVKAHGADWSAEDRAGAHRVLALSQGILGTLGAQDEEARKQAKGQIMALLPPDELPALDAGQGLAKFLAQHETRADDLAHPDEGLIAELYLTRIVIEYLRRDEPGGPPLEAWLKTLFNAVRTLADVAWLGRLLEGYRADPASPASRATRLLEVQRQVVDWAAVPPERRVPQAQALQGELTPLRTTLLGVWLGMDLEGLIGLVDIYRHDPSSHARGWFLLDARLPEPIDLIADHVGPPEGGTTRCRALLVRRKDTQSEVKLRLELPRAPQPGQPPGEPPRKLEVVLGPRRYLVDGKELPVPAQVRESWRAVRLELDGAALLLAFEDEKLDPHPVMPRPALVQVEQCPLDLSLLHFSGCEVKVLEGPAPPDLDPKDPRRKPRKGRTPVIPRPGR